MTQQDIENIIIDYNNGMTLNELIKKYHHCHEIIRKILIDNQIHIRNRSEANMGKHVIKISPEQEKIIITNYLNGLGANACGKLVGIGEHAAKNILQQHDIKIRSQSASASVQNTLRKKYFCNENYFKHQSANMAYILGFIAADGTIRKDGNEIKITLAQKDVDILEKIKTELEYTGNIKINTTQKGFDIATLAITCAEYKKDLAVYNIVPQKTFYFTIPDILEKKYWIDFIRGYWDGDGTICTAGKSAIRASVCSANKTTLEQIIDFLEYEYQIPRVSIQVRYGEQHNLYYIQYSNSATRQLYKAFYYQKNLLYLDRKYKKFCELCIDK